MDEIMGTFDFIMENCPFLRDLIMTKISDEIMTRDIQIQQLTDELTVADARANDTENALNMLIQS